MPPATITGSLHPSNKEAIAWNERGIIAFGCHSTLVFFDVRRLEVFQTLEQHSTAINSICWKAPSSLLQGEKESSKESFPKLDLKCASSDISGNIFVWDVMGGNVCASFRNATTPVNDLKWFNWPDPDREMLLSLHANTWAILWDIGKKERIWEYKFTMPAFKASIDCFDASRMAFSSSGATLLFLQDLSPQRCAPTDSSISAITLEPRTSVSLNKTTESAIVQLKHHAAFPQLLFVLFPSEICLVETQHKQIIYSAIVDAGSPLVQMLPCARRDAIFLVHQNGLVSFRLANFHFSDERVSASLDYERKCFAESLHRQSARLRVVGAALCPTTNSTVAMLMNSGRLLIYQLENVGQSIEPYRIRSLTDFVQLDDQCQSKCVGPLRLTQYGCYSPLTSTITIVRVRPISVDSSTEDQQKVDTASPTPPPPPTDLDRIGQLAAIGSSTGNVHLVNVFTGQLVRALQVHTFPVKCLEWAGHNAIVSSAYIASLSSSNTVRNDLFITDIRTGVKRRIRPEQEESPIEAIRVSHYSSYLAISFRHHPLEIWDLGTQRLLRRMNKRCPVIVDMCWSGKHHQAKLISERTRIFRENLVVLDNDNHLYHVVVKGLHVRDGKEVSTQWKSGAAFLRCMVWKDDVLAFGDSAGRIGVWDLAKSQCRQSGLSQSTRGPVQRIVFSKLTGDYTLVAQHPTSLVVWDTEKLNAVFSLQKPGLSMIDVDMCGLTPVYISSDGMFRIALSENNEKERHFPLTMGDLDTPLLLQSAELEFPELIKDDPDFEEIQSRLTEFRGESSQLNQLAFQHQFKGDLALADFCRVVENVCRRRKMAASNESQKLDEQLPTDLLLLWAKEAYATRMELMTRLLLSTCRSEGQLEQAIENCIIMKKNELATYYLLNNEQQQETPIASREEIRLNAFRACVLSANYDSEEAKCLVKLTATNLIASNFVSEGIQLLSLIDQGLDACKYLISQGFWKRSLAYAKMNPNCDFVEIYQRYAEHLATESVGLKSLALLVLASLGNWERCRALAKTNRQSKLIEQILDETKDEIPNDG